jgi:hypothetical protein
LLVIQATGTISGKAAYPDISISAVWALTDQYSGHDVQSRLVVRDRYGNTRQAVRNEDVAEARRVLDRLGIRHRL